MSEEEHLIKEVDEEVRQDNYKILWSKYGKYIITFVIVVILFVSSGTIYKNYKISQYKKQSELYFEAINYIEKEEYAEAKKTLDKIVVLKNSGYKDLSLLNILNLKSKNKISYDLDKIEPTKNTYLDDFIILQKFNQQIGLENENIAIDNIIRISQPSSPWRFTAHELLAAYYVKKNNFNKAIQSLNAIVEDNESPILMKKRAKTLLNSLKKK